MASLSPILDPLADQRLVLIGVGVIGIIIDARGRPLPIAEDLGEQREKMQRWLWDMGS